MKIQAASTAEIREQLQRILASPQFRNSRRSSDFLRHVVEATCDGRTELLKERSVGVAVFQREPDYDTNQDPIVRNTAGQVRKRLAQYYHEPGHEGELRIDLPPGAYVPEVGPAPAVADRMEAPRVRRRVWQIWTAGAVGFLALAITAFWTRETPGLLDEFWAPVLQSGDRVALVVGQGHTYKLSPELDRVFESGTAPGTTTIRLRDVVPSWDRYISVTDAQAAVRFASLFARAGKEFHLVGGRNVSLGDLRGRPVVLIGAFNNDWTLRLTGELRFYFETDEERKAEVVRDRQNPDHRSWQVPLEATRPQVETDYAIVTRVHNPTTEQTVVVAAGIRGGGTFAAGEFLTNPQYLHKVLGDAPTGWKGKNIQFVLSTKMFSGTPAPPAVIAAHYW